MGMKSIVVRSSLRWAALAALVMVAVVVTAALKPVPQPLWYHDFADSRNLIGLPNAGNVLSNLAFVLVGIAGLMVIFQNQTQSLQPRSALIVLFIGLLLTGIGSSYYHLAPDNQRLVWDRLPMTIAMAGIVSLLLVNRLSSPRFWILPVFLLVGVGSVLQWAWSEAWGHGDLRWYALFEGLAILSGVGLLLMPPARSEGTRALIFALAANVAAKLFELLDRPIYNLGHLVSGHTLKHLSAGLGFIPLVIWLARKSTEEKTQSRAAGA